MYAIPITIAITVTKKKVKSGKCKTFWMLLLLEDTARYAGLLLAPAKGFGFGLRAKKKISCFFGKF